jgi:polar amino acid transport system permease protein
VNDYEVLLGRYLPMFLSGMRVTAEVSALAFVLGAAIGLVGAGARRSRWRLLRFIAGAYVEIIRNTPMLVQVFLIFFGLPAAGLTFSNFQAAVIALGVSGGGYLIEIFRAGFDSLPAGQREAAAVIGLSKSDAYIYVLLPQAMRVVFAPTVGQFIQMILGSSLLSVIGLAELTGQAQIVSDETYLTMPAFVIALCGYLILSNIVALASVVGERYLFKPSIRDLRSIGSRRGLMLPLGRKGGG